MIKVYINYPNKRIKVHVNPDCTFIQRMKKQRQRHIKINYATIEEELKNFKDNFYRFGSNKTLNDMWLEIDLADRKAELDALEQIHIFLSSHYKPFKETILNYHFCF